MKLRYFLLSVLFWVVGAASAQEIITDAGDYTVVTTTTEVEDIIPANDKSVVILSTDEYQRLTQFRTTAEGFRTKARLYREIGWIGGGAIFGLGVALGGTWWAISGYFPIMVVYGLPTLAVGAVWCLAWNLSANFYDRRARAMETTTASIFSNEILRFGNKSLTAGVNVMNNQLTRTTGVGVGLSLNF